jgi:hypothetical protein
VKPPAAGLVLADAALLDCTEEPNWTTARGSESFLPPPAEAQAVPWCHTGLN